MKLTRQIMVGGLGTLALLIVAAVVQAGGWDNFKLQNYKLQNYALTRIFHDQEREREDLRAQGSQPEEATRIDLTQLLDGGHPRTEFLALTTPSSTSSNQ
ncbi:hypothetical protein [Nodosilinea sp. P-1105]|uniref:hypothetical protein n=1 Tax=Nodosilinea sp. P-1105 TaxID=2546229 RepID=UPI00146F84FA|nr:hypothetical protein [Nodosilinea sp. P-1105]NMF86098.1 hypothetical protein [Nodosilinea sp. P-1105]